MVRLRAIKGEPTERNMVDIGNSQPPKHNPHKLTPRVACGFYDTSVSCLAHSRLSLNKSKPGTTLNHPQNTYYRLDSWLWTQNEQIGSRSDKHGLPVQCSICALHVDSRGWSSFRLFFCLSFWGGLVLSPGLFLLRESLECVRHKTEVS